MTRTVALGDPQAPHRQFLDVLDANRLRAGDRLAHDVLLVSMGDHFDFDTRMHGLDVDETGDGIKTLSWLASHDPEQVTILFGNHDACRVMEFSEATPENLAACRRGDVVPELPKPGLLTKDYRGISIAQRELVQRLLLAGRFRLAAVVTIGDRRALATHAALTTRELSILDLPPDPDVLAAELNRRLDAAVDAVRPAWERGEMAALDLGAIYVPGAKRRDDPETPEGGGMLYHRPHDPTGKDLAWEHRADRPRRYDPRSLPRGLAQVVGHTGHDRMMRDLVRWVEPGTPQHASIRTITVDGDRVSYGAGVRHAHTMLVMTDPEMNKRPARECEVLELTSRS